MPISKEAFKEIEHLYAMVFICFLIQYSTGENGKFSSLLTFEHKCGPSVLARPDR